MSKSRMGWMSNQQEIKSVKVCLKGAFKKVKPLTPYRTKKGAKVLTTFSV